MTKMMVNQKIIKKTLSSVCCAITIVKYWFFLR